MGSWGGFFGKIADQFQGRIERLKNEKAKLTSQLTAVMALPCTAETGAKAAKIRDRIDEINQILQNKAAD